MLFAKKGFGIGKRGSVSFDPFQPLPPPPSPAAPSPDEHSALCVGELTENGSDWEAAFTTELPLQGIRVSRMGNYVLLLLKKEKKKSLAGSIDRQTW